MLNYILVGSLLVIITIAISQVSGMLVKKLFYPKQPYINFIIIPLNGHVECAEIIVRGFLNELTTTATNKCVIIADYGVDEETNKICRILEKEYDFLFLCKKDDINEFISTKLNLQNV